MSKDKDSDKDVGKDRDDKPSFMENLTGKTDAERKAEHDNPKAKEAGVFDPPKASTRTDPGDGSEVVENPPALVYENNLDAVITVSSGIDGLLLTKGPEFYNAMALDQNVFDPITGIPAPECQVYRDWVFRHVNIWLNDQTPNPKDAWLAGTYTPVAAPANAT